MTPPDREMAQPEYEAIVLYPPRRKRFGWDHITDGSQLWVFWLRLFGRVFSLHLEME